MAKYQQPVLIYNPVAGKFRRQPARILQRTIDALKKVEIVAELTPTAAAGHATELAREAVTAGADLVLVLGGDGTINEVANGMIPSSVPLGVLPGGTANVLANELGLGNHLERAIERLGGCVATRIAVGKLRMPAQSRYFVLMGGVGLDATIVTKVRPELKARAGKLSYWVAGLAQFFQTVGQFQVAAGAVEQECGFVLVSRVRNYGGDLEIASGASLLSDDFEVVLFNGSNPLRYAAYMAAVTLRQVKSMPGVRSFRARRVEFAGDAHLQIDGEYGGRIPATLEMVPQALTLLIPPAYR
ncbi:MAG: diacylglycerol kinase family protein [Acidobacteriota bacterium]